MTTENFKIDEVKAEWLHPTEMPSMKGRDVVAIDFFGIYILIKSYSQWLVLQLGS